MRQTVTPPTVCERHSLPTGEAHFNSSQDPLLYFNVLLLSQQFEAVSYPHPSPLTPHLPFVFSAGH